MKNELTTKARFFIPLDGTKLKQIIMNPDITNARKVSFPGSTGYKNTVSFSIEEDKLHLVRTVSGYVLSSDHVWTRCAYTDNSLFNTHGA